MNVLIVGSGKGSWEMRGWQLGQAMGATFTSAPTMREWHAADVIVLVKRAAMIYADQARATSAPIVWDALDFWQQPHENTLGEADAHRRLRAVIDRLEPMLVIGATQAMADAAHGIYLPHQSWDGLVPTPPRETVTTVGYEGNVLYLGAWRRALDEACTRRGWRFVVNPPDLRAVDLFVALRDGPYDGWMCRQWKSGVKLVNAIAAGRPILTQPSAAAHEIQPMGPLVDALTDLDGALDAWTPYAVRDAAYRACEGLAPRYRLGAIAARYRSALEQVRASCAA